MKTRVAIIGAGPSGISQLRAFEAARRTGADIPEVVCYEKQADYGGLWNYTWRTGLDEYGEPVHGSMYRSLWSNGPKECLEYPDYPFEAHFGRPVPSYAPRAALLDYIKGCIAASGIGGYIRLRHVVRSVAYDHATAKFTLHVTHLAEDRTEIEQFDDVVVATGHYSTPNVPSFPGFDGFPGRILHSHDVRDARDFAGQNVLLVGASLSAEDIAMQCFKYGAASVTVSYRTRPLGFNWPTSVEEKPLLTELTGQTAHFRDGSTRRVDTIILCTGYLHHFPFLSDALRLRARNRLYPGGLYKGIVSLANSHLFYLGMQDQFYTFTLFDAQAWYARDIMMGRVALPDPATIDADIAAWTTREEALSEVPAMIDFQADYMRDLFEATDYPNFDIAATVDTFKLWAQHRDADIMTYRDHAHVSAITGRVAPRHSSAWINARDDRLEAFIAAEE
jgi:trimethylamine monooxygenase